MPGTGLGHLVAFLAHHPTAVTLTALRPWVLICAVVALFFFRPQPGVPRAAALLRGAAFLALVLVLAGLQLAARLPSDRLTLIAAVDLSKSIDAAGRDWELDYLNKASMQLAPDDRFAVITFAEDVAVARPPGPPTHVHSLRAPALPGATNLGQAIQGAASLFSAGDLKRVLLLTDGNETRGSVAAQIPGLLRQSIRLDIAVVRRSETPDLSVEKLVMPPVVAEGSLFPLHVIARNRGERRRATMTLELDAIPLESRIVELAPGVNIIESSHRLGGIGSHQLRVRLQAGDDPTPSDNQKAAPITVSDKRRILLVTANEHSPLAATLEREGTTIDSRNPSALPVSPAELAPYNCVVLENVTADMLARSALQALDDYVGDFGGGLLVTGGARTFGDARFRQTPLAHMLPVTVEPVRPRPGRREPLALFILIDRSNSMGYNSRIATLQDGEKLRYAKAAALAVVKQLKDRDLIGVIAFDSHAWEVAPLRTLRENRSEIEKLIPRLVENGGTDFFEALDSARRQFSQSQTSRRHLILLTDGDTNRAAEDYYSLIDELAQAKISVTAIRIGTNDINLRLLQDISARTGGQFHHVTDVRQLPELMLQDTTRLVQSKSQGKNRFSPVLAHHNQVMRGIAADALPPLAGYAYTKAKPGAETVLGIARTDRRDPLLALWRYGLGRVAAFTAGSPEDARPWRKWRNAAKFWRQLVRWTAREQTGSDVSVDARRRSGLVELTVRTFGPKATGGVLLARIQIAENDSREIRLVPMGPRVFAGRFPAPPPGRYLLTLIRRDGRGAVRETTRPLTIPAEEESPEEYEHREPNLSLLARLAKKTGGSLNPAPAEVGHRTVGTRRLSADLDPVLIPIAMVLFLAGVAVERLAPLWPHRKWRAAK